MIIMIFPASYSIGDTFVKTLKITHSITSPKSSYHLNMPL
jgi:hypothetical protein